MHKALVVIPTYNERTSVLSVLNAILRHEGFDILVVDDASPDGTANLVKDVMSANNRVSLLERKGKLGLGTAYVAGFKWGLERRYTAFIEMDADGSHNADALPWFLKELKDKYDLVIGSRYLNSTISVVGWDFRRLLLSKFGNLYASMILGLKVTDLTSGYRCYTRRALQSVDLDKVSSNGYSFQIEMAYLVAAAGCSIREMPIIFYERSSGTSKMSKRIVKEAAILPWRLRIERLAGALDEIILRKKHGKEISG